MLYACDLFNVTPELLGPVDYVVDRGSIMAIEPADRTKYLSLMRNLLQGRTFRYFVLTSVYDQSERSEAPYSIPLDEIRKFFGAYHKSPSECNALILRILRIPFQTSPKLSTASLWSMRLLQRSWGCPSYWCCNASCITRPTKSTQRQPQLTHLILSTVVHDQSKPLANKVMILCFCHLAILGVKNAHGFILSTTT